MQSLPNFKSKVDSKTHVDLEGTSDLISYKPVIYKRKSDQ